MFSLLFSSISQGSPSSYPGMEEGCDGSRDTGDHLRVNLAGYKQLATLFLLQKKVPIANLCHNCMQLCITQFWPAGFHLLKMRAFVQIYPASVFSLDEQDAVLLRAGGLQLSLL